MITRRIIGLIILAFIIIVGTVLYIYVKRKFDDVESDNIIIEKKELKGSSTRK